MRASGASRTQKKSWFIDITLQGGFRRPSSLFVRPIPSAAIRRPVRMNGKTNIILVWSLHNTEILLR